MMILADYAPCSGTECLTNNNIIVSVHILLLTAAYVFCVGVTVELRWRTTCE